MARLIPNQNSWIGFATTMVSYNAPTAAEIAAGVDLTSYVISLNASSTGNTLPTPNFSTLFETNISGTVQATFTADFYRDNAAGVTGDLAWKTLPRKTAGYFVVSRYGGTDLTVANRPTTGDKCEIWPVVVTSRAMANMSNNTVMTFTLTCAVPQEPNESVTVA